MSYDVWDRAQIQYETEKEQLRQLVTMYAPLMSQVIESEPSFYEIGTLASMLHSFYTGVENILDRIVREIDGHRPSGDMWHRQLLDQVASTSSDRPAVLSHELRQRLHEYLRFRHFFRNAYTFLLDWTLMAPLVARVEETLEQLESELDAFFANTRLNG